MSVIADSDDREQRKLSSLEANEDNEEKQAMMSTEESIKHNVLLRMNPPKTPDSDGDDIKMQHQFDTFHLDAAAVVAHDHEHINLQSSSAEDSDRQHEFEQILTRFHNISIVINNHQQRSAELVHDLVDGIESGYEEMVKYMKERKEVLLTEIRSMESKNKDAVQQMLKEFTCLQGKMESFKSKIEQLDSSEFAATDEIQKIHTEALDYYHANERKWNLFDEASIAEKLQNACKLSSLCLLFERDTLKSAINQQFKLLKETNSNATTPNTSTFFNATPSMKRNDHHQNHQHEGKTTSYFEPSSLSSTTGHDHETNDDAASAYYGGTAFRSHSHDSRYRHQIGFDREQHLQHEESFYDWYERPRSRRGRGSRYEHTASPYNKYSHSNSNNAMAMPADSAAAASSRRGRGKSRGRGRGRGRGKWRGGRTRASARYNYLDGEPSSFSGNADYRSNNNSNSNGTGGGYSRTASISTREHRSYRRQDHRYYYHEHNEMQRARVQDAYYDDEYKSYSQHSSRHDLSSRDRGDGYVFNMYVARDRDSNNNNGNGNNNGDNNSNGNEQNTSSDSTTSRSTSTTETSSSPSPNTSSNDITNSNSGSGTGSGCNDMSSNSNSNSKHNGSVAGHADRDRDRERNQQRQQRRSSNNNNVNNNSNDKNAEDDAEDGFRSNTHHIFVPDTNKIDFASIKQQYRDIVLICQFSQEYYSKNGLQLLNNRTVLHRKENQKHGYAVLDGIPVSRGKHCWRIKCKNFSPWIFIGVSRPYIHFTDTSWNNKYVYGISTCSQSNRNGYWSLDHTVKAPSWKNKKVLCIDMLLDCHRGYLKYKQIDSEQESEQQHQRGAFRHADSHEQVQSVITLAGLDTNNEQNANCNGNEEISWLPHFNLHTPGSTVSVKKIPYRRFGQVW